MIWKWNAAQGWTNVLGTWYVSGSIEHMAMYGGYLYIAGVFDEGWNGTSVVTLNNIAKVNVSAGTFSALGNGIIGPHSPAIYSMAVCDPFDARSDFLYVGGVLTSAGGSAVHNVAAWNGSSWSSMNNGLVTSNTNMESQGVHSVVPYKYQSNAGNVLAVGRFETANGVTLAGPNLASFNGSSWSSVGYGIGDMTNDVSCTPHFFQGYDCYVYNAVFANGTAYMTTFDTWHINHNYITVPGTACDLEGVNWAKIPVPFGSLAFWDGAQGWGTDPADAIGGLWSDGVTLYALQGTDDVYIVKYSAGSWLTMSDAIPSDAYPMSTFRENHLARIGTTLYLAGTIPQRWIP
jgi:hypothetical protein